MRRFTYLLALLLVSLILAQVVHAQAEASISLRSLQTEQFPLISGFVDARDASGALIDDLQANDFFVFEDGSAHVIDHLRLVETGWRVAVAFNPGEGFAIRDAVGVSRYEYVAEALRAWAANLPADEEASFSLLSPEGLLRGYAGADAWLETLGEYVPISSSVRPDLQTLNSALLLARQPTEEVGMASAIWLITAAPDPEELASIQELQIQASQQNIPIFIWMVDSKALFESDEALALQSLALASGGSFFAFSGEEEIPDAGAYFNSLGSVYTFQYLSEIRSAGPHEVRLSAEIDSQTVDSQTLSFVLDLQTPSPILVSPPAQIRRAPTEEDPETLAPYSQPIEIIVEFPDNYERELARSSLYINGERVADNRAEPFTRFVWYLREYAGSQQVSLYVEVEDELGLIGRSVEVTVDISVVPVTGSFQAMLARNLPVVTGVAALLATGAVFVIFILSGRISPRSLMRREKASPEPVESDPLLDSPLGIADMARPASEARRLEQSKMDRASMVAAATGLEPAYLQPVVQGEDSPAKDIIVLAGHEFVIGSNKEESYFHIDDPSVEGLHASIRRLEDGSFEVADLGTESGTWLNYAPVTKAGAKVHDGDLIHIGRVPFRFQLRKLAGGSKRGSQP